MGDQTDVDVKSLEDFHTNLEHRRLEIKAAIDKMNNYLKDLVPKLGGFTHAQNQMSDYTTKYDEYADRYTKLMNAVTTAQTATANIIDKYKTVEARNDANATDIGKSLEGIESSLGEDK